MALSDKTYSALKASVADWLAKDNLSTAIPDLIFMAEKRLFRLNLLGYEQTQTGTVTGGSAELERPSGSSEIQSIYLYSGDHTITLRPKPAHIFFELDQIRSSGEPYAFTVIGDDIHLGPIPDADYSYVIHYTGKPEHLSDSVATNWLLTNHTDLYLYATLLEAEPFLKSDPRIAVWQTFLAQAMEDVKGEDHESRYSGGTLIPEAG